VRLQVGGIDHQLIGLPAPGRQLGKDLVEHAQAAPADGAIMVRIMRTITSKWITPSQFVHDHEDNPAYDMPINVAESSASAPRSTTTIATSAVPL